MFKCDKCGLCCMHIGKIGKEFGLDRNDGVCKFLNMETKLCEIYNKRPIICNVDKYYEKYLSTLCSKHNYYEANYSVCKEMKERYGK